MSQDPIALQAAPAGAPPKPWGLLGTIAWGAAGICAWFIVQFAVIVAFIAWRNTAEPGSTDLSAMANDGFLLAFVTIMAAPLGIGFSRRGILASVAVAIGLVFVMNFLTHLFLALGEGDRISPVTAAWAPNAIFVVIGLYLLRLRATNREAPSFNPAALWRSLRAT